MNYKEELDKIEKQHNVKIIYCSLVGSKLYGTDNENSDTDLRFVYTNSINDLILQKVKPNLKIGSVTKVKNNKDDVDFDGWSLQRFMDLIESGDTNALDLLFSMFNPDMIVQEDENFVSLMKYNYKSLINNNIKGFIGYCLSQTKRFGIKGTKYDELDNFFNSLKECSETEKLGNYFDEFRGEIQKNNYNYIKIVMAPGPRVQGGRQDDIPYISVLGKLFSETVSTKYFYDRVKKQYEQFGSRVKNTAKTETKKDPKSSYHALRVAMELQELLQTGKITFPLKHREELKLIKENNFDFEKMVNDIELIMEKTDELLLKGILPENSDRGLMNNIILGTVK